MPLIGPSFLILGLAVASVTANGTSTFSVFSTASMEFNNSILRNDNSTLTPSITANTDNVTWTANSSNISFTTSTMNFTNSTITPSTTKQKGNENPEVGQNITTTMAPATPKPAIPRKSTASTTKKTAIKDKGPTDKPLPKTSDSTGIIILVVIIIVALVFTVACYCAKKRGRRYSVDFSSRPDEVNIPLSTVEPVDALSQNGFQTFAEAAPKEPQESLAKPEVQEQKAEADKTVDPSTESAVPAPLPDSSQDKPKEDVMEQNPAALVKLSVEEKTDDEGIISNKTSVESLKETNENNSNNVDFSQQRDLKSNNLFWNIPLNWPV